MRFSSIDFGSTDAREELARKPNLLVQGYLDLHGANELLRNRHFLLVGRKGAGKTAVLEHMRATEREDESITIVRMGSFPFADFSSIDSGGATDVSRFPTTWRILLLLTLLRTMIGDLRVSHGSPGKDFWKAVNRLQDNGLLAAGDMRSLVLRVSSKGAGAKLGLLEGSIGRTEQGSNGAVVGLAESLLALVKDVFPRRAYLICVDGLDDIVFRSENRLRILGSLIEAAADLNSELKEEGKEYKFVVACRNDILAKIPSANLNKLVQDFGVRLNWYQDTKRPERSHLVQLVNRKARVTLPEAKDVIQEFLPPRIELAGKAGPKRVETTAYLLSYTRYTPRDILRLLTCIQQVATNDTVSNESVLAGLKNYAHDYFLDEILNSTDQGKIPQTSIVLDLIREHGTHVFTFGDLLEIATDEYDIAAGQVRDVLRDLYDCGGVGNFQQHRTGRFYTFKFRNENSSLLLRTPMILHNGLGKALNVKMQLSNIESSILPPADESESADGAGGGLTASRPRRSRIRTVRGEKRPRRDD